MRIAIAGGHGQVARHLVRILSARGDEVLAIVRNPAHAEDIRGDGGTPVVLDLEAASAEDLAAAIGGADAVVFAAGAGPGSGVARKETVDFGAAVKLLEAARSAGVDRYIMISAMGAERPPSRRDDVFSVYLRAKARADAELMASGLAWTVVRPGRLTDDPPTGTVTLGRQVPRGAIPRADVAEVVRAVLDDPRTANQVFQVVGGPVTVDEAIRRLSGDAGPGTPDA